MSASTLGALIKEHRINKRIYQQQLAIKIGWKDATRLSKIEQGRMSVNRELLERIINAFQLNENERGAMLLASGIVPTKEEAQEVYKRLKGRLEELNAPVILVDFAWNVGYVDRKFQELFQIPDKDYDFINKESPNWLEILFLKKCIGKVKMLGGYSINSLLPFEEFQISHFKFEQVGNTQNKWYRDLLVKLSKDDLFRKLWTKMPPAHDDLFFNHEVNVFEGTWRNKKQRLVFNLYGLIPTFDNRFGILIHVPADESTRDFYKKR